MNQCICKNGEAVPINTRSVIKQLLASTSTILLEETDVQSTRTTNNTNAVPEIIIILKVYIKLGLILFRRTVITTVFKTCKILLKSNDQNSRNLQESRNPGLCNSAMVDYNGNLHHIRQFLRG